MAWAAGIAAGGTVSPAAQTLDRVVASIGNLAITASDVEQEYRFERFLDAQWPPPPPNSAALAERPRASYLPDALDPRRESRARR